MSSASDIRTRLTVAIAAAMAVVLAACSAHAEISKRDMQVLSHSELIFIATVRKDGNQSKAAPVWFTIGAGNKTILIQTGPKTWKAKRIRRGSPVLVWIGAANGPAFIGKAEITTDAAVQKRILDDFERKYWLNRVFGVGPSRGELNAGRQVAIVITPARDLPDGYKSAPGTPPPPLEAPSPTPGKGP
jgi:general stress protein 26